MLLIAMAHSLYTFSIVERSRDMWTLLPPYNKGVLGWNQPLASPRKSKNDWKDQ